MIKKISLIALLLLIFTSCSTSPPTDPTNVIEFGKVYVTSNFDGAKILVDGTDTGFITPDTLQLEVGYHEVKLEKEGFNSLVKEITVEMGIVKVLEFMLTQTQSQKIVIIEDFSNVSCIPCVSSNRILNRLESGVLSEKIVVIKFPTNFPSPNDPMYLLAKEECDSRVDYYNIFFTPTIIVDGLLKPIASDSSSIAEKLIERSEYSPKFNLATDMDIEAGSINVSTQIIMLDESELNLSNLLLHTVVLEKKITFDDPPGSNGEKEFHNVVRDMLPNKNGTALTDLIIGEEKEANLSLQLNPLWDSTQLRAVVFIQDLETKEIYQGRISN